MRKVSEDSSPSFLVVAYICMGYLFLICIIGLATECRTNPEIQNEYQCSLWVGDYAKFLGLTSILKGNQ